MKEIARQVFETDRILMPKKEIENLCLSLLLHQHPVLKRFKRDIGIEDGF